MVNCQLIKLKVKKLETQEQHTSGGELPENETTRKEPETEEKHSSGSELPKYEEPKTQGDHSSDGDIPKDEIISEETKPRKSIQVVVNYQKMDLQVKNPKLMKNKNPNKEPWGPHQKSCH